MRRDESPPPPVPVFRRSVLELRRKDPSWAMVTLRTSLLLIDVEMLDEELLDAVHGVLPFLLAVEPCVAHALVYLHFGGHAERLEALGHDDGLVHSRVLIPVQEQHRWTVLCGPLYGRCLTVYVRNCVKRVPEERCHHADAHADLRVVDEVEVPVEQHSPVDVAGALGMSALTLESLDPVRGGDQGGQVRAARTAGDGDPAGVDIVLLGHRVDPAHCGTAVVGSRRVPASSTTLGGTFDLTENSKTGETGAIEHGPGKALPVEDMPVSKARTILERTGVKAGYAMLIGVADEKLAAALAENSQLALYCPESARATVAAARKLLDNAGVYGKRVAVHEVGPDRIPYADYFANLLVVNGDALKRMDRLPCKEIYRVLRPYGGKLCVTGTEAALNTARERFIATGTPEKEIATADRMLIITRGTLPGAGNWTHEYANSNRSSSSTDSLVRLPLKMLWFGGAGSPDKLEKRHSRGSSPLFVNGVLIVAGKDSLMGVDGYNGRLMWELKQPGAARYSVAYRGGNIVADDQHVYVIHGTQCLQVDFTTGETRQRYEVPVSQEYLDKLKALP